MSAITINPCPSVSTEVDVKLRTAFDLTQVSHVRVQAWVVSPLSGTRLTLKYSLDDGATWASMGPYVSCATAGDQRGASVSVPALAKADVVLSLFVSGGDGINTLVLGNAAALAYRKTGGGDPPPIIGVCGTCAEWLAESWDFQECIDFAGYADLAAFIAWMNARTWEDGGFVYASDESASPWLAYLDAENGNALTGYVGYDVGTDTWAYPVNIEASPPYLLPALLFDARVEFHLENGFDMTDGWGRFSGLVLFDVYFYGLVYGTGGGGAMLVMRDGRVFVDTQDVRGDVSVDVGAISTFTGRDMAMTVSTETISLTEIRLTVCMGPCGGTIATLYDEVLTSSTSDAPCTQDVYFIGGYY